MRLIKIDFLNRVELFDKGFKVVQFIEKQFSIQNLYFTHYANSQEFFLKIVTEINHEVLDLNKIVHKKFGCVKNLSIEDQDEGSLIHCYRQGRGCQERWA